jgi:transposase InsO family protein
VKRRYTDVDLVHHSARGCTYASEDYRARLEQQGIRCSMSRRGNCYDHAVIESWFSTVKSEEGELWSAVAEDAPGLRGSLLITNAAESPRHVIYRIVTATGLVRVVVGSPQHCP